MPSNTAKIASSQGADEALDRMVKAANEGFNGGKVTKHELTSWIITYFEESCLQKNLEKIRQEFFDEVTYLESIVQQMKRARKNGETAPDLAPLISKLSSDSKKPVARSAKRHPKAVPNEEKVIDGM